MCNPQLYFSVEGKIGFWEWIGWKYGVELGKKEIKLRENSILLLSENQKHLKLQIWWGELQSCKQLPVHILLYWMMCIHQHLFLCFFIYIVEVDPLFGGFCLFIFNINGTILNTTVLCFAFSSNNILPF